VSTINTTNKRAWGGYLLKTDCPDEDDARQRILADLNQKLDKTGYLPVDESHVYWETTADIYKVYLFEDSRIPKGASVKRAQIRYTYAELAKALGWRDEIVLTNIEDDPNLRTVNFLVDGTGEPHVDGNGRWAIRGTA
jgi:hypothetical protein